MTPLKSEDWFHFHKSNSSESKKNTGIRFTLMDSLGGVIMDSEKDPLRMDNHKKRPEVIQAKMGVIGYAIRYSKTLEKNMMYVAIPTQRNSLYQRGVIRASLPLTFIEQELHRVYKQFILMGLFMATAIGLFSFWLSHKWSQPLEKMKQVADEFSRGNFTPNLPDSTSEEIYGLGVALNKMAKEINLRIQTTERQKKEQEAILSSLVEGVIATDENQAIFRINQAAYQLFQFSSTDKLKGQRITELIRNTQLSNMVQKLEDSMEIVTGEFEINWNEKKTIEVYTRRVKRPDNQSSFFLFVFHDVTAIKKMETMRKDFVANVSHELNTPITTIKGFVETLLGGAMKDPVYSEKFLNIILKQSDNLKLIVEELLILSKIEQSEDNLDKEEAFPHQLISNVMEYYNNEATENKTILELQKNFEGKCFLNTRLMEQALSNLLQNAIRYNAPETLVIVGVRQGQNELEFFVKDNGPGIPIDHQARLFERFYRLDPSRSREVGGTGLGLAIVKHIAQAHGGRVGLKSNSNEGSCFSIYIPLQS